MRKASCLVFQLLTINNSREGGKYIHISFLFFHNKNRTIASNTTNVSKHRLCVLQFCTENNDEQPIKTSGLHNFYYNNYNNTDNDHRLPRFYLFKQASTALGLRWSFNFVLCCFRISGLVRQSSSRSTSNTQKHLIVMAHKIAPATPTHLARQSEY